MKYEVCDLTFASPARNIHNSMGVVNYGISDGRPCERVFFRKIQGIKNKALFWSENYEKSKFFTA
jgi:hypothetical protein